MSCRTQKMIKIKEKIFYQKKPIEKNLRYPYSKI